MKWKNLNQKHVWRRSISFILLHCRWTKLRTRRMINHRSTIGLVRHKATTIRNRFRTNDLQLYRSLVPAHRNLPLRARCTAERCQRDKDGRSGPKGQRLFLATSRQNRAHPQEPVRRHRVCFGPSWGSFSGCATQRAWSPICNKFNVTIGKVSSLIHKKYMFDQRCWN